MDAQVKSARAEGCLTVLNPCLVLQFPLNFTHLERIKMGQLEARAVDMIKRTGEVFENCPKLKYACLPHCPMYLLQEDGVYVDARLGNLMRDMFIFYHYAANYGPLCDHPNSSLECYDFENYRLDFEFQEWNAYLARAPLFQYFAASAKTFIDICMHSANSGLKLMNVNSLWFCGRWYDLRENPVSPNIGIPIVSLVNLDPCIMDLDMPNLEKIWIPLTSHCVTLGSARPEWPKLKTLDITVDGNIGYCWDVIGKGSFEDIIETRKRKTSLLFKELFPDTVRVNMTELSLQFVAEKEHTKLAVPKTDDIVNSCPNLKKLKLRNWQGKNSALVKLWNGLPGLI